MAKSGGSGASRVRSTYTCSECGWSTPKWVGRCADCAAWGSLSEQRVSSAARLGASISSLAPATPAVPIGEVPISEAMSFTSGVAELDRVLGGGIVPGAVVLLAGEPGVGKSTLLLEVAAQTARAGSRTLYVTGEESAAQVRLRADRCRGVHHDLYLAAETDLGAVLGHIEELRPKLIVIDSIQTISAQGLDGVPGGVSQVKEVTAALVRQAKTRQIPMILVGHVTKDGGIAGPRVLEHLVDVVLNFEGEPATRLRMVRAIKNRFGPIDEIGCFDLSSDGIRAVLDPSGLFVSRHHEPVPGTCVSVTLQGRRPILAEIQALVSESSDKPRRVTSGLDGTRVAMVLAVLEARAGVNLQRQDLFASTVGGAKVTDPAGDLAIALAVATARHETVLTSEMVAMGEIGLAGELRRVPEMRRRLAEAARLGVRYAVIPAEPGQRGPRQLEGIDGLSVYSAPDLRSALAALDLIPAATNLRHLPQRP